MSSLLREYVRQVLKESKTKYTLLEATLRAERPYYGLNIFSAPEWLSTQLLEKLLELLGKEVELIDVKNRFIAVIEKESSGGTKVDFRLLNRDWTGDEIKTANGQFKKSGEYKDFDDAPFIFSTTTTSKKISWLISKAEELGAETAALRHLQASFAEATEDGQKSITVLIANKTFNNVGSIKKNENKAAHSDFVLFDAEGKMIEGSGISHKVQKGTTPPQAYSAVTKLSKNINASGADGKNKELVEFTKKFINESIATYKNALAAGLTSYVSGWYSEIVDSDFAEIFIYGQKGNAKDESAFIVISNIDGMTLKPVASKENTYELDVGSTGRIYSRDSDVKIPSGVQKPVLMFRPGTGGSKVDLKLNAAENKTIESLKNELPDTITINNNILTIRYKVHVGPKVKAPGGSTAVTLDAVNDAVKNAVSTSQNRSSKE